MIRRFLLISLISGLHSIGTEYCHSAKCEEKTKQMNKNIDPSISPCEDFWRYSCGGYKAPEPYQEKLRSHWRKILKHLMEQNPEDVDNLLLKKLSQNVAKCESGGKSAAQCLDEKLNSTEGLIGNIFLVSQEADQIYSEDAQKVADRVNNAFPQLVYGWIPNETIEMRKIRNQTYLVLVSKSTLPTKEQLARILRQRADDSPEDLIRDDSYRPKWVSRGFSNFTEITFHPEYGFLGECGYPRFLNYFSTFTSHLPRLLQ